jgi:hypothetical protein
LPVIANSNPIVPTISASKLAILAITSSFMGYLPPAWAEAERGPEGNFNRPLNYPPLSAA